MAVIKLLDIMRLKSLTKTLALLTWKCEISQPTVNEVAFITVSETLLDLIVRLSKLNCIINNRDHTRCKKSIRFETVN